MMAQGTGRLHFGWQPLPREMSEHYSPCLQATINLNCQRLTLGQASVSMVSDMACNIQAGG